LEILEILCPSVLLFEKTYVKNYLNAGAGNPCAGHRIGTPSPELAMNVLLISPVGNFGDTLPIGSK
jgi:hypothetical protein